MPISGTRRVRARHPQVGLCSLRYPLEAEANPSYNPLGQQHSASRLGGARPPDSCGSPSPQPLPATPQRPRRRVARGGQRPARVPPSQSNPGVGTRRCHPEASGRSESSASRPRPRRRGGRYLETSEFRLSGVRLGLHAQLPLRPRNSRSARATPAPHSQLPLRPRNSRSALAARLAWAPVAPRPPRMRQ